MYVIPLLYRLTSSSNHLSINRLHQALHAVIKKHNILRTALYLDANTSLIQHCLDLNHIHHSSSNVYGFTILNLSDNNQNINEIIKEILNQSDLFDLSKGKVIHCHIIRQYRSSSSFENDDLLINDDLIL